MFNCFKKNKEYEYDIIHLKVDGKYVVDYYPMGYIEMHYKKKCMEAKKLTEENEQLKAENEILTKRINVILSNIKLIEGNL